MITSRFSTAATAADVAESIDLSGQTAIITGGASGIGRETARVLATAGADVTLAVRNLDQGLAAAAELNAAATGHVSAALLDLADPASIAAFARRVTEPVNILINNAGVMAVPTRTTTPAGLEIQLATNHLGHFLLSRRLHGALLAAEQARVVSLSSSAHHFSGINFDDINFERRPYDPWAAYGQSKTANALFAVEAQRRWRPDGITVNAVMPGNIETNLQRFVPDEVRAGWGEMEKSGVITMKTIEQGAATTVWAATAPELTGIGGLYLENCREASRLAGDDPSLDGVHEFAVDPDAAVRLWELSESLDARVSSPQ
ncbi:SDR family NAD(P)-dependent oxidoreductase [Streptomyces sp. NPDC102274]|uniref:SDR family NAD(P)-dependent oxidoreductase n=1 Tax=Streptomyces sp. NPDC102274 TaxID=3366151 RepID=UPI003807F0B1